MIISKDRAQKGKRKATVAAAIADGWNLKDKPYQALSYLIMFAASDLCSNEGVLFIDVLISTVNNPQTSSFKTCFTKFHKHKATAAAAAAIADEWNVKDRPYQALS